MRTGMGTVEKTRCQLVSLRAGASFSTSNELKIPNLKLKLKVKISAHFKKLQPNQDYASDHFLSARRLYTRPTSNSTGARLMAPHGNGILSLNVLLRARP